MEYIVTYSGECFTPLKPNIDQIHIEDLAHTLSLLCRANGNIDRFFSIAQHSMNCALEAKARGYTTRVQLACLVHDGSEAYISDITRPVKFYLMQYKEIEKQLQDYVYRKFLGSSLTSDEAVLVDEIDDAMLVHEFDNLSKNKILFAAYKTPLPELKSVPSFETRDFTDIENEFMKVYYGIMHAGLVQGR